MATSFLVVKNNAVSSLASGITDVATSLTVASGEGSLFPSTFPFHISIEDEILSCTNRVSDVLTVTRAQQGTSGVAHGVNVSVGLNITAKSVTDLNTSVNALEDQIIVTGSDPNTTIEFDGSDAIIVTTGGTEALRIDSSQNTLIADENGLVIGHTAQVATNFTSEFQVIGTGNNDSSMSIQRYSADATAAFLWISKSRGALGTPGTAVVDNDGIGEIRFTADDGGDLATSAVAIRAEVDDAIIGANEVGGALVLSTAAGASANDLTEALRIDSSQGVYIGDTANANMTVGLTINQGVNDDEILALKSSDVGHGMTDQAETDTWGAIRKVTAGTTGGGMYVRGFTESTQGVQILGAATLENSTKTASGRANVQVFSVLKSGTGFADHSANANLFGILDASGNTKFIVDQEGDFFYDGTGTAYDYEDDVSALRAFSVVTSDPKNIIKSEFDQLVSYNEADLVRMGVLGDTMANRGLVNGAQLQRLQTGAIWQQHERHMSLVGEVASLKQEIKALTEGK